MTISTESIKAGPFNGNDSTTSFSFTFKVFQAADLRVVYTDSSGSESDLTLDSDYSVSLNADQDSNPGGSVTYPISGSPLATGDKLTILNELEFKQSTDLKYGGAFRAGNIEDMVDRSIVLATRCWEAIGRAVKVTVSSGDDPDALIASIETSESNAASSASAASTSETNAAASEASTLSYLEDFKSRYVGASASDPATDGNGDTLTSGDLYFNTASNVLKVYNGATWQVIASADDVTYSNSTSGLTATDVQAAIDEVDGNVDLLNGVTEPPSAGGTGDAITVTTGASSYTTGNVYSVLLTADNTGAATINLDSLGAKDIKLLNGNDPGAGNLKSGAIAHFKYDGTNMVLLNPETVFTGSDAYPSFACRAWVNFNGTGTVAISASGNVSSITDNGTGDYTINFTVGMPDVSYGVSVSGDWNTSGTTRPANFGYEGKTTTSVDIITGHVSVSSGSRIAADVDEITVTVYR